jgi:hypothetical protein
MDRKVPVPSALRDRILCLPTALVLAMAAVVQLRSGIESTPLPLREMAAFLFGHDADTSARLVVGGEIALAVTLIVCGSRWLAITGAVASAFVALACVSAARYHPAFDDVAVDWPAGVGWRPYWRTSNSCSERRACLEGVEPCLMSVVSASDASM